MRCNWARRELQFSKAIWSAFEDTAGRQNRNLKMLCSEFTSMALQDVAALQDWTLTRFGEPARR